MIFGFEGFVRSAPRLSILGVLLGVLWITGCRGTDPGTGPKTAQTPPETPAESSLGASEPPKVLAVPSQNSATTATEQPETAAAPDLPNCEPGTTDSLPVGCGPAKPPDALPIKDKYKFLLLGDSLAATGFGVMLEDRLDDHPKIECVRTAKSATGLARPDFYNWPAEAKRQVDRHKPDVVVVILGGNDGQDLPPAKGLPERVQWGSEDWSEAYKQRVREFSKILSAPQRYIIWLALPPMSPRKFEQKLTLIRTIHSEVVAELGSQATYLDTAPFLQDDNGRLKATAMVRGKLQKLREADGIHFTMAGSEYFADAVYAQILSSAGPTLAEKPATAPSDPVKSASKDTAAADAALPP